MQKTNRDFLNPVLISLTYDLKDVKRPSLTRSGADDDLLDMNQFPIINKQFSSTNITVRTFSVLSCRTNFYRATHTHSADYAVA